MSEPGWWVWLDIFIIACTFFNIGVIVRDWRKSRRRRQAAPGSEATVADLTRRNIWQADQLEKLSRQLWDKESERLMLQKRLERLGVGEAGGDE
jgi:hypothetical protein